MNKRGGNVRLQRDQNPFQVQLNSTPPMEIKKLSFYAKNDGKGTCEGGA